MEYVMEREKFIESYSSHLLFNLCDDINNCFSYKKNSESIIAKHFNLMGFEEVIEYISDSLIRKGSCCLYYEISDKENNIIELSINNREKNNRAIKFKLPQNIIPKRSKILKKLTKINKNIIFQGYDGNINKLKYVKDMELIANIKINKITKSFYYDSYSYELFTDYYNVYRHLNMLLVQRKIIDYILKTINIGFKKIFNLDDDDIILFNGKTLKYLNDLLVDLKNNYKSISEISDKLYK